MWVSVQMAHLSKSLSRISSSISFAYGLVDNKCATTVVPNLFEQFPVIFYNTGEITNYKKNMSLTFTTEKNTTCR